MKANELMIGDFVTVNNKEYWPELKDIPLEVCGISETVNPDGEPSFSISLKHINQKLNTYYEEYSQFIHFLNPIKLNQEWLDKFEWQLIKNGYYINSYFSLDQYCHVYYSNDYTGLNMDYVHQLQRFYRSIKGEELMLVNKNN